MSINEIINAYIRMSMLLFASRRFMLSPLPLQGQPWSPKIRFQESWPVLSGPQHNWRVVMTSWHFLHPRTGQQRWKNCSCDPADGAFLCGQTRLWVQGGTAVGQIGVVGRLFDYLEQIGLTAVAFLNHPVLAFLSNLHGRIQTTETTEEDYLFVHYSTVGYSLSPVFVEGKSWGTVKSIYAFLYFYLILCEKNWIVLGSICGHTLLVNTSDSILLVFTLESAVIYARDRCVQTALGQYADARIN